MLQFIVQLAADNTLTLLASTSTGDSLNFAAPSASADG